MTEGEVVWMRNSAFLARKAELVPTKIVLESLRVVLISQIAEILVGVDYFCVSVHLKNDKNSVEKQLQTSVSDL